MSYKISISLMHGKTRWPIVSYFLIQTLCLCWGAFKNDESTTTANIIFNPKIANNYYTLPKNMNCFYTIYIKNIDI